MKLMLLSMVAFSTLISGAFFLVFGNPTLGGWLCGLAGLLFWLARVISRQSSRQNAFEEEVESFQRHHQEAA